jgi:hypothetical protein
VVVPADDEVPPRLVDERVYQKFTR